jgi:osmotically-inducible protein OsmY
MKPDDSSRKKETNTKFMNMSSGLQHDVEEELRWDPSVRAEDIGVTVKDEVVQLNGHVNSLLRVYNVKAVANEIKVEVLDSDKRSDADIARAAITHLEWNYTIPPTVKVKVSNGWVTFEGTVEKQYQKNEAERILHSLKGVKGLVNEITITPKVDVDVVKERIVDAFTRNAVIDGKNIQIESFNGMVTLRGHVRSWAERIEARRTASAAPGVTSVADLLTFSQI